MQDDYIVRLVDSLEDLEEINRIRCEVFVEEQGYPKGVETDDYDLISAHLVLCSKEDSKIIIGAIRFLPYPLPPIDSDVHLQNCKRLSPLGGISDEFPLIESFFQYKSIKNSIAKNLESENNGLDLERDIVKIKFGRVAIDKSYRGRKLGEKMLLDSEKWFLDRIKTQMIDQRGLIVKGVEFRASSQHFVVGFYQRLGYKTEGGVYDDTGTPHQLVKKLIMF